MSTANRVIKNTGFLYAKMGITMFISLYTTRLILNSLGAEDFGIFNIVGGAIAMLGCLCVFNIIWKAGGTCRLDGSEMSESSLHYDKLSYLHSLFRLFIGNVVKETTPSGGGQLQICKAKGTTPKVGGSLNY